jgi:hypothetical protein
MSVNLNSNIIKAVQPFVNRAPVSYNFSADAFALGGGGGGQSAPNGGGGGGGALVSASISVVPNITWTINVGGAGAADTNGQDTYATIYNDTYAGITTLKAQGGRTGVGGNGGNSGTGSLITPSGTFNYTGFTGGAVIEGGGRTYGGGGAGNTSNGTRGIPFDGNPGTGFAGNGGFGVGTFPFAAVGGGGGGTTDASTNSGGNGNDGGGAGAGATSGQYERNGYPAINYGAGGGGARNGGGAGIGGTGSPGTFWIQFVGTAGTQLGQYDITVTNGTISGPGDYGITTVIFNSGSGTFRYNAPYPYVPGN